MTQIALSRRLRSTPYTRRVEEAGVTAYTVYNHMLLPTTFGDVEAEAEHLKRHVQVWDVSVERQVEISGPDAAKVVQKMTPRDLSKAQIDQCFYIPVVDGNGGMINDPVAIKLSEDRYWLSVADSDVILYAKGLALGIGADVTIFEPQVDILAVQGPKSDDLMARVFGEDIRSLKFFRGTWLPVEGKPTYIARSGYSKHGGFEIYLEDPALAEPLWDTLFAAGEDLQVKAGCPNLIERIESGLLSYGNDMTLANNPYECDLAKYCKDVATLDCVGRDALMRIAADGPERIIRGVKIDGKPSGCRAAWPLWTGDGVRAGQVTSAAWSPAMGCTVAIGMVERDWWEPGTPLHVETPDGTYTAEVVKLPFGST